ncbi:MAG TPA: hypothetical protein VK517_05915 [Cyclobacteriaceae bacterium]|nr:hypothetical protein [Cyclobacteriaceae bacterium]
MKTSNILLIVLFVISISLTSAVPIMFNLKLKNGDFVENRETGQYKQKFGAAKFIFLNGLGSGILVPSDSLMLESEASQSRNITTDLRGDTLFIRSNVSENNVLTRPNFKLYLTGAELIQCTDTNIELKGAVIPEQARSYHIDLFNSNLVIKGRDTDLTPYRQFFDQLFIKGKERSQIDFSSQLSIRNLDLVNIQHTLIDGSSVAIDEINTMFDPKAIVKMKSLRGTIEISATP